MSFKDKLKNAVETLSSLAVIVAAGALLWTLVGPGSRPSLEPVEPVAGASIESSLIHHVEGEGEVAVVEFTDFECPFCRAFAADTRPVIQRNYVATGRIRYISMHFPLEDIHPLALEASVAAECAARQTRFWAMHDLLFSSGLTRPDLMRHAAQLGLDEARFEACLGDAAAIDAIRADQRLGEGLGVEGTPTFFVGTLMPGGDIELTLRINGNAPPQVFADAIEEVLASR